MVMDETVLRMVFEGIDSSRVPYGTDFPVAAMTGRRVRMMDHWVDVVAPDAPASSCRVRAAGLPEEELRRVFFKNGMKVLTSVNGGTALARVEAGWQ
jgi:hypothetical protein